MLKVGYFDDKIVVFDDAMDYGEVDEGKDLDGWPFNNSLIISPYMINKWLKVNHDIIIHMSWVLYFSFSSVLT